MTLGQIAAAIVVILCVVFAFIGVPNQVVELVLIGILAVAILIGGYRIQ